VSPYNSYLKCLRQNFFAFPGFAFEYQNKKLKRTIKLKYKTEINCKNSHRICGTFIDNGQKHKERNWQVFGRWRADVGKPVTYVAKHRDRWWHCRTLYTCQWRCYSLSAQTHTSNTATETAYWWVQGGPKKWHSFFGTPWLHQILTDFQNYFTVRIRRKYVIILWRHLTFHKVV